MSTTAPLFIVKEVRLLAAVMFQKEAALFMRRSIALSLLSFEVFILPSIFTVPAPELLMWICPPPKALIKVSF